MMKQANPEVKFYLNSVLKDIEHDNKKNAVKYFFSEELKRSIKKKDSLNILGLRKIKIE